MAIKSQPVPQFVRPKLDVEPFVKLGDRIAAGHGRELCAHGGCWCFRNSCPLPAIDPPAENGSATTIDHLKYDLEPERGISF